MMHVRNILALSILAFAGFTPFMLAAKDSSRTHSNEVEQVASEFKNEKEEGSTEHLKAPEYEVQRAIVDINNAARGLNTLRSLSESKSLGPRNVAAMRSFDAAKNYFRANEPLSVIRETNNYLNLSQTSSSKDYLHSLYMLGHAYLGIGMEQRAIRAYRRYIGAYLASPERDDDQFFEVLKKMLPLAAKQSAQTQQELDKLLAAVTSINLEHDEDGSLLYLAGETAAKRGHTKLAWQWFSKAAKQSSDDVIIARAWYYQSLMALAAKNFDEASTYLGRVLELKSIDPDMRNLTHQALARTSIHLRRPQSAIVHYNNVEDSAPFYRDVLFELTYVYLDANEEKKAYETAQQLIKRYPNSKEAINLSSLLAYLELRSGELEKAQSTIDGGRKQLSNIDNWLLTHLQNRNFVPFAVLNELITKTELDLRRSPITADSQDLFLRINEVLRNLADIRGELRDTLYTIGRAHVVHFRPVWENRIKQIDQITRDLLTAGHRLASSEAKIYESRLSPIDKQRLEASATRRNQLFSEQALFRRQVTMWTSWTNIQRLSNDVAHSIMKLHETNAELNSLRLITAKMSSDNAQRRDEIDRLLRRQGSLQASLYQSLEIVRKMQVMNLATRSEHAVIRSGFIQFANALYEEASIMQPYRDKPTDHSLRAISLDTSRAWQRWEYVARVAFETIEALQNEMIQELRGTIESIEQLSKRHDELVAYTVALNDAIESHLGESIHTLVTHYRNEIDQRLSSYRKWQAELEWLRFQRREDHAANEIQEIELQKQILRDNLDDMIQGVTR